VEAGDREPLRGIKNKNEMKKGPVKYVDGVDEEGGEGERGGMETKEEAERGT
jgi:hypothetical protein